MACSLIISVGLLGSTFNKLLLLVVCSSLLFVSGNLFLLVLLLLVFLVVIGFLIVGLCCRAIVLLKGCDLLMGLGELLLDSLVFLSKLMLDSLVVLSKLMIVLSQGGHLSLKFSDLLSIILNLASLRFKFDLKSLDLLVELFNLQLISWRRSGSLMRNSGSAAASSRGGAETDRFVSSGEVAIQSELHTEGLSVFPAKVVLSCHCCLLASNGRVQIWLEATTSTGDLERDIFDVIGCQADTLGNLVVSEVKSSLR